MRYFVDTETTGLSGPAIEVALVDESNVCWFSYIKTGVAIEPGAQAVHGITQQTIDQCGITEAEAGRKLATYIHAGDELVAHNAAFDRPRFERLFEAAGLVMPCVTWTCTLAQAREIFPGRGGHRLDQLAEKFGFKKGNHSADEDAFACKELFYHLAKEIDLRKPKGFVSEVRWAEGGICWRTQYTKNDKVLGPVTEIRSFNVLSVDLRAKSFMVWDWARQDARQFLFGRFADQRVVERMLDILL